MNDYRDEVFLLDGDYIAKCIGQDFITRTLTFEVEPNGLQFTRQGECGVEIIEDFGEVKFEDVKHLLPKINK